MKTKDERPKWLQHMPEGWQRPKPTYDPRTTNHERHLMRRALREDRLKQQRQPEVKELHANS